MMVPFEKIENDVTIGTSINQSINLYLYFRDHWGASSLTMMSSQHRGNERAQNNETDKLSENHQTCDDEHDNRSHLNKTITHVRVEI